MGKLYTDAPFYRLKFNTEVIMLNKKLLYVVVVSLVAALLTLGVCAVQLDSNNKDAQGIYYTLDADTMTAAVGDGSSNYCNSGYSGAANGVIVIPETVEKDGNTYVVDTVSYYAFKRSANLTSVTLPATVKTIENCAFFDCTALVTVALSEGLETIGASAFAGCTVLENVAIPSTVESIGYSAFYGCKALTNVALPEGITEIGNRTFACNENLTGVTIPATVTSLAEGAFTECSSLEYVALPKDVTSIGESVFSGCTSLETLIVYKNLDTVGDNAFWSCDAATVYLQQETKAFLSVKNSGIDYMLKGDANGDKLVGVGDAITMLRYIAANGIIPMDESSQIASDVKRDGRLAVRDVIALLQYIAAPDNIVLD